MKKKLTFSFTIALLFFLACGRYRDGKRQFADSFNANKCTFLTTGQNYFFILEPGYRLILKGKNGNDSARLVITVTNETKQIGNVETRIVEEHESINGNTVEISRNFFAFCRETSTIFYFGEEVDIYKDGKITGHEGAWIAEGKNRPGVMMPGIILPGSRYYQEIAPGIAMDRAEIINSAETMKTPAGDFANVLKIKEKTPLEPLAKEYKYYAPGVGLIMDENLVLVKYGFID